MLTNVPEGASVQAAAPEEVAPMTPYFPSAHRLPAQDDAPEPEEYMPAGQSLHSASAADVAATTPLKDPGEHGEPLATVQDVDPGEDEYVPPGQGRHVAPAGLD